MSVSTTASRACVAAMLLIGATSTLAQETYATLIENHSTATIDATPTMVIFHLSRVFNGDSVAEASKSSETLAPDLQAELKEAGYERAALSVTGPMIPDAAVTSVRIEAEIRLSLGATSAEGTRSTALANAVDKIAAMATKLQCTMDGPLLDVNDRPESENKAVQRAIENAYTRAQAAAAVMRVEIVSVDRVIIESVTWHDRPGTDNQESSADRIGVTVAIGIAYLAFPPNN